MGTFLPIFLSVLAVTAAIFVLIFLFVPLLKGAGWFIRHLVAFIGGMLHSALRLIGGILTALVLVPMILLNIVIGRWSASRHYGRSLQDEFGAMGQSLYRLCIGHPARLFMLTPLVEGIERRVPQAVANAPTADKPSKRTVGQFDGYTIVGSLKAGGSGGKLYVANPDPAKRATFERRGVMVDQVVIKVFSLAEGSTLPQIVRESKSLDAAKRLGLILDHDLNDKRFFYVMPYVPGDTLSIVTNQLHDRAGPEGLSADTLREAVGYVNDLVRTLDGYHQGGLWHKDVKPDNIIVSSGRAHLVDFGLITPLRSAMTLTTHGTEYFRDPEMVRLALRGVKVQDVDGAKFDIYACGAVLYSVIERSFPAHGGLSQITRRCPEGLRWIIRRAMADYNTRYPDARSMLDDIQFVMAAADPFAVRPADLPSMRGGGARVASENPEFAAFAAEQEAQAVRDAAARATPRAPRDDARYVGAHAGVNIGGVEIGVTARRRHRIRVTDWLRGSYVVEPAGTPPAPAADPLGDAGRFARDARRSAAEQLANARARVAARRGRVASRLGVRPVPVSPNFSTRPNSGVVVAFFIFLGLCVLGVALLVNSGSHGRISISASSSSGEDSRGADLEGMDKDFKNAFSGMDEDFKKAFAGMGDSFKKAFGDAAHGFGEASGGVAAAIEAGKRAAQDGARIGLEAAAEGAETVAEKHRENAQALRDKADELDESDKRNAARDARRLRKEAESLDKKAGEQDQRAAEIRSKIRALELNPPAPPAAPAPVIGGSWLILDDFPAATSDPAVRKRINDALTVLRGAQCELKGVGDDNADLDTVASARKALGVALPNDPAAAERLRGWLASSGQDLRGVVWFGKVDERTGVRPVVVLRDGDKSPEMRRAVTTPSATPAAAPEPPSAPAPR